MKRWIIQGLIALDQLINALLLGWADETISSRAWRLSHVPMWRGVMVVIDAAFHLIGQRDHCFESYVSEQLRSHFPPELRGRKESYGSK